MKKELRISTLKKRAELTEGIKKQKDNLIEVKLLSFLAGKRRVALYVSMKSEVETQRIIQKLLSQKVSVVVPKVNDKTLDFFEIQSLSELKEGIFGVFEPISTVKVPLDSIECFVT
ncbi:MAG: 5-formyltetrahydrofolate cyclo-ligase, partial [Anaerorhabdus sp.]